MSNLKDLVPPLELCQQIPDGEFAESFFIWVNGFDNQPKVVFRPWDKKNIACPAPTLEEIWKELPDTVKVDKWGGFHIKNDVKNGYGVSNTKGATAALKLWLKLKGN